MSLAVRFFLGLLALPLGLSRPPAQIAAVDAPQIWVADESVKVRPSALPPAPDAKARISLAAAGGECTGAQIVVEGPVKSLRATATPLRGAAVAVPVSLARVATMRLVHPSGPDGADGEWPDALIPARDSIWGEERNAFPIDVAAGRAQAIFVEACVPSGAGSGRAKGAVRVAWQGGAREVSIELSLRGFDLPATSTLRTAFGFSGYSAARGHGQPASANRDLTRQYDTMALRRGITLMGGTQDAPPHRLVRGEEQIDWTAYDAEVGPFLDGTALPGGARWTSVELREPARLTREERRAWRVAWVQHFEQRGWADRLYSYVEDEPAEDKLPAVELHAHELLEDAPRARRLVTTALSGRLPSVDLWVELLNCFAQPPSATCPRPVSREAYAQAEAADARVWWYQSCVSHGCAKDGTRNPEFQGWPSYMIDAPATDARAMGTLAFANRIAGELYFDVVYEYDHGDPWQTQWAFGGNGDGTLYYPGTPARIGGSHQVPVESLRLVQISRGLRDHDYLALCANLGDERLARSEAARLAPSLRGFSRDPHSYEAMRARVGDRIEALLAASSRKLNRAATRPVLIKSRSPAPFHETR